MNQKIALTEAQLQPSASNSPKKARRLGGDLRPRHGERRLRHR